jgi:hypothetical protein
VIMKVLLFFFYRKGIRPLVPLLHYSPVLTRAADTYVYYAVDLNILTLDYMINRSL